MTAMAGQRRSQLVTLSLIGVAGAAIVAAEALPGTPMRRNLYADRAACEADYSPSQCQPATLSGGYAGHGWWGPEYTASRRAAPAGDPGPGRHGLPHSVGRSVRGGFGGFARAAHAGS